MDPADARRVLGVRPTASPDERDRAFRRRARTAHPDAGGDPAAFERLVRARDALESADRSSSRTPVQVVPDEPLWRQLLDVIRRRPAERTGRVS